MAVTKEADPVGSLDQAPAEDSLPAPATTNNAPRKRSPLALFARKAKGDNANAPPPKEKEPVVSFGKLFRFADTRDRLLIFFGLITSAVIGALMPCSILVLGSFLGGSKNLFATSQLATDANGNYILPGGQVVTKAQLLASVDPQPLYNTILIFVYFGIAMLFSGYLTQLFWVLSGENQTRRIRQLFVKSVLRQDVGWFDLAAEGSLTTRLAQDTALIQDGISEKAGMCIQSISQFIAGFVIAFVKGPKLALVLLASLPLLGVVGTLMIRAISKFTGKGQDAYAGAGAIAEQVIGGIRTVYSFSLQKRFIEKYDKELAKAEVTDFKKGLSLGIGFGSFMLVIFGSYGLAFWYGSRLVLSSDMEGQDVLVVFFSMIIGAMALIMLPTNLSAVSNARGAAFKIYAIIDRVPTIDSLSTEGKKPAEVTGFIQFKDVHFTYPSRPDTKILHGLTLDIESGKTVAFVGPSGSGKSTIVQLIQRFYDPSAGDVVLDENNLKDLNVSWLRQHIGIVGQEPVLFNTSIKQNILMGAIEEVTESQLINACKMANCHAFITKLPQGYDTSVGEHGGMLSGGQKQRIAIARALIKNPRILLLDEATSALDTQSERIVQEALDNASKNRTTIVIAHRLSTIRNADVIVVLDHGVIAEIGNHSELLKKGGVYAGLVEKQRIKMEVETTLGVSRRRTLTSSGDTVVEENGNGEDEVQIVSDKDDHTAETRLVLESSEDHRNAVRAEKKQEKDRRRELKKQDAPIRRVLALMKPEWGYIILGCLGASGAAVVFPVFALIFSTVSIILLDPSEIDPGPFKGANLYSFLFVVMGVIACFSIILQLYGFEKAGAAISRRIRLLTFAALLRQEVGFYDEEGHSLGALTSRLAVDALKVGDLVTKVWGDVAQLIVTAVAGFLVAFINSWQLTLILVVASPFIGAASFLEARLRHKFEDETKKLYEDSGEIAGEAFKEIRTVTALNRQHYFEDKYNATLEHPHQVAVKKAQITSLGNGSNQAASQFAYALGFYAGIRLALAGIIDFKPVLTVLMAIMITAQGLGRASNFVGTYTTAKLSAINTFELIDRVTKIDPDADGIVAEEIDGDFEFKNVQFTYPARPNQPIFDGKLSVKGNKNLTVALVGPSGCGKSTTVGIIQRWYDISGGQVQVDGKDVKEYQLHSLRKHMALVGQEPVLFDMSIRENILAGTERTDVSEEELTEIARMANILSFLDEMPDKLDTRVGDKGSQLSGGQKQRVAIARALIRNPRFLLLDEATSALDSESEKHVQQAIDNAIKQGGRTTITIAHRLSTIQDADLIVVIKDGAVVEQGTHFELLALNGVYNALVKQQDLSVF
ncbi:P-loop containing nucleoside triphosphate hydrolase protein [Polychytrium aggregatum]|uniref:P-loop containing nucleoside triphosphate hydrolase protein n=1 Tax=Polychytrium aggregatum TaxID=110093 RepID=UPI0022FEC15A|nr:P-loop containing nucleoside triphosphate hydrolase protein [Polychytrium aggregatum]KAI9208123.1 P-loop containing nucleoside triphosphate hydrolase protein [Polychytrium aggregatum]